MKVVLVTGVAGFIGYHLARRLLEDEFEVIGLDNINNYYDPELKFNRLKELGIKKVEAKKFNTFTSSTTNKNFKFIRLNLEDREGLSQVFNEIHFDEVINLAAQAGVRYSLKNPQVYIDSNIVGFANLLDCCRNYKVKNLIYASSSSVYGQNKKVPFSTEDNVDHPISLYAATKKSNELMAYTYSYLYDINTIGLRFFTVYGPWGRPDMAMFLFTDAIINGRPIKVFNYGDLERDFTYIDDIISGIMKILRSEPASMQERYSLYNIGNSRPIKLMDFIEEIENQLGKKAKKNMLPMQPGDVSRTWADVKALQQDYNYHPNTSIKKGIGDFIKWYKQYYSIK